MFDFVFPLRTYLHVLQLEQYDLGRFWLWWSKNIFTRAVGNKKPLVWTLRLKIIALINLITLIILMWVNVLLGMICLVFPLVPMIIAGIIFSPFVWVSKMWIRQKTFRKINLLKKENNLLVIGISGSYGKTSVKEYLYQILSSKFLVVRTPESYNTLLGIAKVVDLEIDRKTQIFICEMGAFRKGEIRELCEMVLPDYAMLTGLNEQHLEKFGSLENEIEGESESVDFVLGHRAQGSGSKAVVNVGNKYIKERWEGKEGVVGYGEGAFETPMKQNIAGAKVMAKVLGMELSLIEAAGRKLMSPKHRLNVSVRGDLTIIDDAFSSNTDGFRAAVDYLNSFDGHKVIVTPGIVELGGETARIHMELGEYMRNKVNQVILVGKNDRTSNLEKGFGGKVEYVEDVQKAQERIVTRPAVILYENDLTDNY